VVLLRTCAENGDLSFGEEELPDGCLWLEPRVPRSHRLEGGGLEASVTRRMRSVCSMLITPSVVVAEK